jgi:molybdate transport system substrate-binding protein
MKRVLWACLLVLFLSGQALAEPLTIAAGAGYKKLVTELVQAFEAAKGIKTELVFGNMGQVTAQAKGSGAVDVIVGEQGFLEKAGLSFSGAAAIGQGVLVVAWPKGKTLTAPADVAKADIKRVGMPDPQKAIYGKAASEYLEKSGLKAAVADKLLVVATVPQVTMYLLSGEVDAGFVNRTDVIDLGPAIGGYLEVDPSLYAPIAIVAERLTEAKNADGAKAFTDFATSDAAKAIAKKHGM